MVIVSKVKIATTATLTKKPKNIIPIIRANIKSSVRMGGAFLFMEGLT
jgi:hypothetical protein